MIVVVFEVWLRPEGRSTYLELAASLADELRGIDGFLSVERFHSLTDPDKLLSLSLWRDEAAVAAWRNRPNHRDAQAAGRDSVFRDYRLRIAAVVRDYGAHDRAQAPVDSRDRHG